MNKDKGRLLDSFYNGAANSTKAGEHKNGQMQPVKNATYSLKLENIHYVELRATHFESKSAFINHLIESDMSAHPDIVEMAKRLVSMKEE